MYVKIEYVIIIFIVIVIVGLIYNYNIFENFNDATTTTTTNTQQPSNDTTLSVNNFDIKEINKNYIIFQIDIMQNKTIISNFTINIRVETYKYDSIKNDYVLIKTSILEYDKSITEDKIILDDNKEYYYKISAFLKINNTCESSPKYVYPNSIGDKPFKLGVPMNKQIVAMAMVDNILSSMQENNLYYGADGNCDNIKSQLGNYPNNLLYKNVSLDDIASKMLHSGLINVNLK